MFIGEMGCWLFVGVFSLYAKYHPKAVPPQEEGYESVVQEENGFHENDGDSIHSNTTLINPAVKVLVRPTDEGRIPLVGWKVLMLALPAICDICGTTLMNVGLLFVVPSIYQMTRGALVLFVGLFSVIFLRRKLHLFQWFALVTVVLGVAIVGLAGAIYKEKEKAPAETVMLLIRAAVSTVEKEARTPEAIRTMVGVFLIAGAQVFTASQFVLEEYILEKYALEPLKVVGWEGLFGFLVTVFGMIVLHLAIGRTTKGQYGYFDMKEGFYEMTHFKEIGISSILIMISIG
jgi:drug/metabolite transporter (DMT)-like permease